MKAEIKIEPDAHEPYAVIFADAVTEEVMAAYRLLCEEKRSPVLGFAEGRVYILAPSEIVRIYTADRRVYAVSGGVEYQLRNRLYELEERLSAEGFVRISSSELISMAHAASFDLSLAGTIRVKLKNGDVSYVSRRYVSKIKAYLGL